MMWEMDTVPFIGRIINCKRCKDEVYYLTVETEKTGICQRCRRHPMIDFSRPEV
jgi:uncharacterized protein YceH (UPF0502 family)